MAAIRPEILALLACPQPTCRGGLALVDERLVCGKCGLRYRMDEGWPVLIPEEAEPGNATPANSDNRTT